MTDQPTDAPPPSSPWPCLRTQGRGADQRVVLDVSVSPNAKKTELVGWHDGALRIRLAAPPADGAANEALCKWLAKALGLPRADVALIRGMASRRKQLVLNTEPTLVHAWLARQPALQNSRD